MAGETRLELLDKLRYVQHELYEIKEIQEKVLSLKSKPKIALNTVQQDSNDVEWQEIPLEGLYSQPRRIEYRDHISKAVTFDNLKKFIIHAIYCAYSITTGILMSLAQGFGLGDTMLFIISGAFIFGLFLELPYLCLKHGKLKLMKLLGLFGLFAGLILGIVIPFTISDMSEEAGLSIVNGYKYLLVSFVSIYLVYIFVLLLVASIKDNKSYKTDIKNIEEQNRQINAENESIRQKNESIRIHNQNLSQINAEIARKNAQKIENAKRKNIQIDKDNRLRKIKQAELAYDAQIRLENLQDELSGDFIDGGAYPPNYLSIHAVNFFVDSVENRKADNISDLVNLYDHWVWELLKEQNAERRHQESNMKREMILKQLKEYNVVAEQTRLQTEIINKNLEHLNEYAQTAAQNTEAMSRKMDNIENSVRNAAAASAATAFNSSMARSAAQDMANNTRNIANNTKKDGVYFDI
ncbi:MAG: hypothetical protein K6E64_03335 [Lachnospiraceae bacterium]|nr:hypothetical protein [Lachnospiraceae bacterium]